MLEAAQNILLTPIVLLSPWRLLWKQHCPEQSCLGQRSSCQKCWCTVCRGERHCRGWAAWAVGLCFSVWLSPFARFSLGFAVLLALVEVVMWEFAVQLLWFFEIIKWIWLCLSHAPRFVAMRFSSLLPCKKHVCALLKGSFLAPTYLQFPNLRFEFQCLYQGCSQHLA